MSLGNVSYPQTVTITLNGPSAPGWQGWISVPSDNAVIAVGLEGTKYDGVFPPTSADEQWTATVDPGRTDNGAPPTSNAKTQRTVHRSIAAASDRHDGEERLDRPADRQSRSRRLGLGEPVHRSAVRRPQLQSRAVDHPERPLHQPERSFDVCRRQYAIGGVVTAQHEGQEVPFTDYDANTIYRLPGTDTVSIQNNNPADLWTIPDAVLADGTPNPDNVFRIRNLIGSPLEATPGDDTTWTYQQDWSSAVGSSTPGTAAVHRHRL